MLTAIFPDSCAFLNKSEYLLFLNLGIVMCYFKIISRTWNYNNSFMINKINSYRGDFGHHYLIQLGRLGTDLGQ